MSPHEPQAPERAVETAMAQVLAAELAAHDSIASARVDAQHVGERSRAAARGLAERTQRRIHHLRAAFERATGAEVAALQAQAEALTVPHEPDTGELGRIDHAVLRLAAQLTGAAP